MTVRFARFILPRMPAATKLGAPLLIGVLAFGCSAAPAVTGATSTLESPSATDDQPTLQVSPVAATPTASSVADLVERVSPSVVNITTVHQRTAGRDPMEFFFRRPGTPGNPQRPHPPRTGAGTGFVIDGDGYVITNAHVVHGASEVKVRLQDDREFDARVVGRDTKLDLALLKMDTLDGINAVPLGDSNALRVGEHVLAVGNPFGLGHTVTMGIVSAKARSIGAGPYDDFIQTDASINPGNSGGPLFNLRGEVVGINTAIRAGADGIGFAIPVEALKDIVPQLRQKGFVERGKLGLMFQSVTPAISKALGLERPRGALVSDVQTGGAADRAGIRAGDLIIAVNDDEIRRAEELPRNVARHAPGRTIEVRMLRDGREVTLAATLDKLEDNQPEPLAPGPTPEPSTDEMLGLEITNHPRGGVRVVGLTGQYQGIRRGDVIVQVSGKSVADVEAFRKVVRAM